MEFSVPPQLGRLLAGKRGGGKIVTSEQKEKIGQNNHLRCPDRIDTICHNPECATFEVHGSKVTKEKKLGSPKLGESEKRFSSLFGPI